MEKKYIKSEIVEAMKDVIAPVVQRLDGIEQEQKRMGEDIKRLDGDVKQMSGDIKRLDGDVKQMSGDIKRLDGDIQRMDGDIQMIKKDLAQKPDRDEVKTIIRDELKNNPSVYIFDRDGLKGLVSEWHKEENHEKQVKDILKKERIIA
ncbi:MAG: hypothetical protein HQK88_08295 [Nitrospirae bacterium]|nr:hypothetical protein [Nitrospirota bacterium]MBF0534886.1 hypothetical protein [Nitrospirota bacterium]MBF0616801.1 hypothetical protein [Nitrospirota bacterium]